MPVPQELSCIRPPDLSKGDYTFGAGISGDASISWSVRCTDTCSEDKWESTQRIELGGSFKANVSLPIPGMCGVILYSSTRLVRTPLARNRAYRRLAISCWAIFTYKAYRGIEKGKELLHSKIAIRSRRYLKGFLALGPTAMCKLRGK